DASAVRLGSPRSRLHHDRRGDVALAVNFGSGRRRRECRLPRQIPAIQRRECRPPRKQGSYRQTRSPTLKRWLSKRTRLVLMKDGWLAGFEPATPRSTRGKAPAQCFTFKQGSVVPYIQGVFILRSLENAATERPNHTRV